MPPSRSPAPFVALTAIIVLALAVAGAFAFVHRCVPAGPLQNSSAELLQVPVLTHSVSGSLCMLGTGMDCAYPTDSGPCCRCIWSFALLKPLLLLFASATSLCHDAAPSDILGWVQTL